MLSDIRFKYGDSTTLYRKPNFVVTEDKEKKINKIWI